MATYRYDHIHFRSEDPLAARAFWEGTFGATVVRENLLGGAPSFTFDLNGMRFQVSGRAEGENPVKSGSEPRYGLDHFGLVVDDMDNAAAELRAKGVEFICDPWEIRPGVKIAFSKRSFPAQNTFPLPVRIAIQISGLYLTSVYTSPNSLRMARLIAFLFSGRFSVIQAM